MTWFRTFYLQVLDRQRAVPHNFYNVLNDKLEALNRDGNLPIFNGFYTEYLDENETHNKPDYKFILKNNLNQN